MVYMREMVLREVRGGAERRAELCAGYNARKKREIKRERECARKGERERAKEGWRKRERERGRHRRHASSA